MSRYLVLIVAFYAAAVSFSFAMDEKEKEAIAVMELLKEQQDQDVNKKKDEIREAAIREASNEANARENINSQARRRNGEVSVVFVIGFGVMLPMALALGGGFLFAKIAPTNEDRSFVIGLFVGGLIIPVASIIRATTDGYAEDFALSAVSWLTVVIAFWYFRNAVVDVFSEKIN